MDFATAIEGEDKAGLDTHNSSHKPASMRSVRRRNSLD
jgi:hypothetical protein